MAHNNPSSPNRILKALIDDALNNASNSHRASSSQRPSIPDHILRAILDDALNNASTSQSSTPNSSLNIGSTSSRPPLNIPSNLRGPSTFFRSRTNPPPGPSRSIINTTQQEEINIDDLKPEDLKCYQPLYHAALKGNWEDAKTFLLDKPDAVTVLLTPLKMTALHVAASEGHSEFVEEIVKLMPAEALEMRDINGATALHHVAVSGCLKAAKALIKKNTNLTNILDRNGCTPLLVAVGIGATHKDTVWYLSMVTKDEEPRPFTGTHGGDLAFSLSAVGFNDILLYLMESYPELATATARFGFCFIHSMASAPSNFFSGSKLGFWECWIYKLIPVQKSYGPPHPVRTILENPQSSHHQFLISGTSGQNADQATGFHWLRRLLLRAMKQITPRFLERLQNAKLQHQCAEELVQRFFTKVCLDHGSLLFNRFQERTILRDAATFGIVEIVKTCLLSCPELAYGTLIDEQNLLSIAVKYRQEKIFNLFCEKNFRNSLSFIHLTKSKSMLHIVSKLAPFRQFSSVSGAALQMQRELQWFKTVEKFIHPSLANANNKDGKTAREIFTEEHKALAEAGEKWMKDTSNSCMIISTLIATFMFAAAFTVPGGNDDDGNPIFLWTKSFLVFAIADALALFSSITSLLMFFSILTARYAEEDFLQHLPKKLIFGLAALFFSIATMMMAFGATLYIVLNNRLSWVSIPIILLAIFPVTIFALLQFPLFIQMFRSTFGNSIFRPQSPWR